MFGKGDKYARFECPQFDLPKQILKSDVQIKNERHFIEFLLRNDWAQRMVGIKMPESNGFFPDIKGEIYDGSGDKIKVEVEFRAENFIQHGHRFKGCDLILAFYRSPETRFIKGIPVWGFYEAYKADRWGFLCLYSDIRYDFANHVDEEDDGWVDKRMWWEKLNVANMTDGKRVRAESGRF